jgi:putative transposase
MHHIIIRGIERLSIFKNDFDREKFMERLSTLVPQTQSICYIRGCLCSIMPIFLQLHFSRIIYFFMDVPIRFTQLLSQDTYLYLANQ